MASTPKYLAIGAAGFVVLALIMLIWLVSSVLPGEKDDHDSQFVDAVFTVRRLGEGPYDCAETRNCQCSNVIGSAPRCGNLHTSGACDNGYHCCREECDRCRNSNGSGSRECNCRCVSSVNNQQCQNYISTCYTPWAEVTYEPDTPTSAMTSNYNDCLALERPSSECRAEFLSVIANLTASCGIDQRSCATTWLDQFTVGGQSKGVYNMNNFQDIHLGVPTFTPSAGLVAGIILSGLFMCCCSIAACIAGCTACSMRGPSSRGPTNLDTGIKSPGGPVGTGVQMQPVAYPGVPPPQTGVPMAQEVRTGYPSAQPQGYPPAQPQGYPPAQPQGYPPAQPQGYPPAQPQSYPPASHAPGYGQPAGYSAGYPQQAYPGAPQPYPGAQAPQTRVL